jgi:hypothetical protein
MNPLLFKAISRQIRLHISGLTVEVYALERARQRRRRRYRAQGKRWCGLDLSRRIRKVNRRESSILIGCVPSVIRPGRQSNPSVGRSLVETVIGCQQSGMPRLRHRCGERKIQGPEAANEVARWSFWHCGCRPRDWVGARRAGRRSGRRVAQCCSQGTSLWGWCS